jgi:hypothetical protein
VKTRDAHRIIVVAMLLLPLLALLAGCGGGGGGGTTPTQTGKAAITITWPNRSRVLPAAANSIKLVFTQNGTILATQVVPRPVAGGTSSVTVEGIHIGTVTVTATAYPNADGTGVAQAVGTTIVTITEGGTTAVTLNFNSTIDHLELSPSPPGVTVGGTNQLTILAKDASGGIVLTTPSKITWDIDNHALATVDANGLLTGVAPTGAAPGHFVVTVTDTESGKTISANGTVSSGTTVSVNPPTPTMSVGDPQDFTATVGNTANTAVTWSVVEGAAGGTITTAGHYVAPATRGTYHVKATSVYDTTKSATATVTVQAGSAIGTIQ